jgi:hypothetical protein
MRYQGIRFDSRRRRVDLVADVVGVVVVHRHPDLELGPRTARDAVLGVEGENHRRMTVAPVFLGAQLLGIDDALLHAVLGRVDEEVFDADACLDPAVDRVAWIAGALFQLAQLL